MLTFHLYPNRLTPKCVLIVCFLFARRRPVYDSDSDVEQRSTCLTNVHKKQKTVPTPPQLYKSNDVVQQEQSESTVDTNQSSSLPSPTTASSPRLSSRQSLAFQDENNDESFAAVTDAVTPVAGSACSQRSFSPTPSQSSAIIGDLNHKSLTEQSVYARSSATVSTRPVIVQSPLTSVRMAPNNGSRQRLATPSQNRNQSMSTTSTSASRTSNSAGKSK